MTLSGKDYKVRTLQDALCAKALRGGGAQPLPVAAITEPVELMAAVFPQNATITADQSITEDSDLSIVSVSVMPPLKGKHFIWTCQVDNPTDRVLVKARALIDSRAHMVLIRPDLVKRLNLPSHPLKTPEHVNVAMGSADQISQLTHYVVINPASLDTCFRSRQLHTVIALGLCMPLILGLPFLCTNRITCNYAERSCLVTTISLPYDLMTVTAKQLELPPLETVLPDVLMSLLEHVKLLSFEEELQTHETKLQAHFACIFKPPPHVRELPEEPVARIKLKDPNHCIKSCNYLCPCKWKEAWHTLLQQHLEAGRIRPSSAPAGSSVFIIPKAEPTVLPRWVNNYRQLNTNTVANSFQIPLVNEILADLGQGKVFTTLDMTNSFFQM